MQHCSMSQSLSQSITHCPTNEPTSSLSLTQVKSSLIGTNSSIRSKESGSCPNINMLGVRNPMQSALRHFSTIRLVAGMYLQTCSAIRSVTSKINGKGQVMSVLGPWFNDIEHLTLDLRLSDLSCKNCLPFAAKIQDIAWNHVNVLERAQERLPIRIHQLGHLKPITRIMCSELRKRYWVEPGEREQPGHKKWLWMILDSKLIILNGGNCIGNFDLKDPTQQFALSLAQMNTSAVHHMKQATTSGVKFWNQDIVSIKVRSSAGAASCESSFLSMLRLTWRIAMQQDNTKARTYLEVEALDEWVATLPDFFLWSPVSQAQMSHKSARTTSRSCGNCAIDKDLFPSCW